MWISTSERLPELHERVLCYLVNPGGHAFALVASLDDWPDKRVWLWADDYCTVESGLITHWMPLPEPPQISATIQTNREIADARNDG
jgi:hypothetical protein